MKDKNENNNDINENNGINEEIKEPEETENKLSVKNIERKKFYSKTIGITVMILIFTIISVGLYSPLKSIILKENKVDRYIGSNDFAFLISDLIKHTDRTEFHNKNSYTDRYNNLVNIKYYIKNTDTNSYATNIPDLGYYSLEKEISDSRFYMNVLIDKEGNPAISHLKTVNFNKTLFLDTLKNDYASGEKYIDDDISSTSEMEIQIIVPEKLSSKSDVFTRNMKSYYLQINMLLIIAIGGIGILILIIMAFATPFSTQKKATIVKLFNGMYLEFKLLIWICFLFLDFGIMQTVHYNAPRYISFDITEIIYDANIYFYLVGIPVAFTIYYLTYLSVCYIKYIHHKGFVDGLVKNTILGKLVFCFAHEIKDFLETIIDTDETKELRNKLFILLGANLLIMIIIPAIYPFGWIIAIGFTIFLFNYLMKALEKIKFLNEASALLSQGDFDIVLPEDPGFLSPFTKNLNNIKEGFKIAVEKEVKSQNMKTELITNVSHDLKTPLTSIITYIDLLKTDGLDEDTKNEYIDILDKKSKRLKILIDDLFDISNVSSGNIELHLERLDVIALLRQTLGELEEKVAESNLKFRLNLPDNKVICELDGRKTYRIFENIMSNIFKYSMKNSRVYIDVEEDEGRISFIFKNMASYEMNFNSSDITERFIRGDASRGTDGSGLGLAIAKNLAELQKGSLDIIVDGDLFKLILAFPKAGE